MIIHQVLHGYRNGHNLLASSIHLQTKDDDLIKVVSDWSEYAGGTDGDSSYITAYALPDSGLYAVAKTWYADEKDRPGCVWTHTLLIDIANLDSSFDFRCLMSMFKRPVDGEYESYCEPVFYNGGISGDMLEIKDAFDKVYLMYLYVHLLQPSNTMFVVERASEFYQILCLTYMQHLPVSILKNRSFSSGSDSGRIACGHPFSLQFTSRVGIHLSNSKELKSLNVSNFDEGIEAICSAIAEGKQDISQFIRLFDTDINGDVAKLSAIGKLYAYMDKRQLVNEDSNIIEEVIQVIVDAFPNGKDGTKVKAAYLGKNVSNLFAKEEEVLSALGTTLNYSSFDYNIIRYKQRVDEVATSSTRAPYYSLLDQLVSSENLNIYGQDIVKNSPSRLSLQDLLTLTTEYWNTYLSLISTCPKLLENGMWVDLEKEEFEAVYELFSNNVVHSFNAWDKLFLRVLYQHYHISTSVWDGFLSNVKTIVGDTLEYLNVSVKYELDKRLSDYVADNIEQVSLCLSSKKSISKAAKQFVFFAINPRNPSIAATNSNSWRVVSDSVDLGSQSDCVFLFLLSYNWKDTNAFQFLRKAYYPIYKLLQDSKLEWSLWNKIVSYTENLYPWQEWDKCKKMRKGVVKYLRSAGYPKDLLKTFTPEKELNNELMRIWK